MSFKDFRVLETVGKGSFASVYKVGVCGCFLITFWLRASDWSWNL
jgi:hypothetical protein